MKHFAYVWNLTRFAFRANPLLYASIFISLFSAAVELLAMSSLMPLFELVSGGPPSTQSMVARGISRLGFAVTAQSLLWAFIVLFAIRIVTQLLGQSISTFLGKRVMAQLCSGAFSQIMNKLSISDVNQKSVGFYISLAGDESSRASNLILALTQFVSIAALAGFYFAAMAVYSPEAATFVALFMVSAALVMVRIVKTSHRLGVRQTEESRRASTLFLDSLNNIKAVRAFSAERYVVGMHRVLMFGYSKILFWVDEVALLTKLVPVLLLFLFFSIWLAISQQKIESVGVAFIVTMIVYLMRFFPVVGQGVNTLMRIASDAKSGRDVTAILDAQGAAKPAPSQSVERIDSIELRDISFAYEATGKQILKNVSVRFARGRSYALVGRSGLGKSTLMDILLKFHEPSSGGMYINGIAVDELGEQEIRRRLILVSQEAAIFDDTVKNNICMGQEASLAAVQTACQRARIDEAIHEMPAGYDTRLQYRGANLSGGQRQRIGIARALLRDPDVLILDEGTSALDKETQTQIVDSVLQQFADRIVILITHDPQVIARVDVVMDLEQINAMALEGGEAAVPGVAAGASA